MLSRITDLFQRQHETEAQLRRLVGDASIAREQLDWSPSVSFEELVALLVDAAREELA
jgi:GDP-D-mannose dehydratase